MEGLFNPTSILLHLFNAAVLFAALYFLLFKPVSRYIHEREEAVAKEIGDAHALFDSANATLAEAREKFKDADHEIALKAAEEQTQAKENARRIITVAKQEAERILKETHGEADKITAQNQRAIHEFAVSLALDMSAKMLGREVAREDHLRLIDEFLNEVE